MKIAEVRKIIEEYSEVELRLILSEVYKILPKKLIEEKNIDSLIKSPAGFIEKNVVLKKEIQLPDLDDIEADMSELISDAKNNYYCQPNQIIHKKDRIKWRFTVKRFVKDLNTILSKSENTDELKQACKLTQELLDFLKYAEKKYLFNTSSGSPFDTIGVLKEEFFRMILSGKFKYEETGKVIKDTILSIVNSPKDYDVNPLYSMSILMASIKDNSLHSQILEQCIPLRKSIKDLFLLRNKKIENIFLYSNSIDKQKINALSSMIFKCYVELERSNEAVNDYKENYLEERADYMTKGLSLLMTHYGLEDS